MTAERTDWLEELEQKATQRKQYGVELAPDCLRLIGLVRLGRELGGSGQRLHDCSAVRETGACGQCEQEWQAALAAFREADHE